MSEYLRLEPVLDLKAAAPLRAALMEQRGRPIELDATSVQRLGGLCLQVLIAARRAWNHDGQPMAINPRSEAFNQAVRMFGAAAHFEEVTMDGGVS